MLASYATGLIAIVILSVAWVGVQSAWRKVFPGVGTDPDALAGRIGCHGCDHADDCDGEHSAMSYNSPVVADENEVKELKDKAECPQEEMG